MSEVKVNKISPRTNCGTVQLGDSGDTITIPSGVTITNNGTQTGFGRTGTVNWDTTAKTAAFTAVSGNGYFINTTSSAITMTLPASPSAGDIVSVKDYAYTFATNNLTVARNGSPIGGGTAVDNVTYDTDGDFLTFIYVDATQGWVLTDDSTNTDNTGTQLIAATGGTVTTCGDYKIHTFTGPGTFCVTAGAGPLGVADYLVIAGGGGGGRDDGGGGGAGGFRESKCSTTSGCWTSSPLASSTSLPFTVGAYPVTVGSGGAGATGTPNSTGAPGSNSVLSTITSTGGGGGSRDDPGGLPGGSGGGGHSPAKPGGNGNTPPVSPPQGNNGGAGTPGNNAGGGGGGAGSAGGNGSGNAPSPATGGTGGNGIATSITGSSVTRAGGGGGGAFNNPGGNGGPGGGGDGATTPAPGRGNDGQVNTGSGAGGGSTSPGARCGGDGGSGIVVIRYKYQ